MHTRSSSSTSSNGSSSAALRHGGSDRRISFNDARPRLPPIDIAACKLKGANHSSSHRAMSCPKQPLPSHVASSAGAPVSIPLSPLELPYPLSPLPLTTPSPQHTGRSACSLPSLVTPPHQVSIVPSPPASLPDTHSKPLRNNKRLSMLRVHPPTDSEHVASCQPYRNPPSTSQSRNASPSSILSLPPMLPHPKAAGSPSRALAAPPSLPPIAHHTHLPFVPTFLSASPVHVSSQSPVSLRPTLVFAWPTSESHCTSVRRSHSYPDPNHCVGHDFPLRVEDLSDEPQWEFEDDSTSNHYLVNSIAYNTHSNALPSCLRVL